MSTATTDERAGSDHIEQLAHEHPQLVALGRGGWVAKGIVYGVLGVLAVSIALGGASSREEASQVGAVAELADSSLGAAALWIVAAGLGLYAAWRLVTALLPAERSTTATLARLGYAASAIAYAVLAWTALSFAGGGGSAEGSQSEDARVERFTRDVMERSGGRWLVGIAGAAVVALAVYFVVKGVRASFRDELDPAPVGPVSHEAVVLLGRIGWVGRGIVVALVGWLLLRAAVRFDPEEAEGFDGALRQARDSTLGAGLVLVTAVALILYGVFCVVSAPRQRLQPPS